MLQIYIIFSVFLLRKCEKIAPIPKIHTFVTILRHFYGSCLFRLYFPEKGCHLGTNRSDNET